MQVLSTQGERTNDIARSVQNGDTDILVLWLACRRLVMQTARRWHRAFNGSRGVVLDDLEQVGFLALTKAAETWNPDSGAFSTWLTFQLKTAFAAAYFMRTERDRKDPLNDAVSGSRYKAFGRSVRAGKTGTESGAFLPAGDRGRPENSGYGKDSGSKKFA